MIVYLVTRKVGVLSNFTFEPEKVFSNKASAIKYVEFRRQKLHNEGKYGFYFDVLAMEFEE